MFVNIFPVFQEINETYAGFKKVKFLTIKKLNEKKKIISYHRWSHHMERFNRKRFVFY